MGERVGKRQSQLRSIVFPGLSQRNKFEACGEGLQTELSGKQGGSGHRESPLWDPSDAVCKKGEEERLSLLFFKEYSMALAHENPRDPALLGPLGAGILKGAGRK